MRSLKALIFVLLISCSSSPVPGDVIPPEQMKKIVFDLVRADVFVDNYVLRDTALTSKRQHIKYYEQVFAIHKISQQEFYKSFRYYQQHPDVNKILFDSIQSYSGRQRDTIFKLKHEPEPKKKQPKILPK